MKRVLILVLLISANTIFAQNKDEKAIKETINAMMALNMEGDMKGALDYTYPKLFEITPRSAIEAQLDQIEAQGMKIEFKGFKIDKIGDVKTYDEYTYAYVDYTTDLLMKFINDEITPEIFEMTANAIVQQYGSENATINKEEKSISIHSSSTLLAIKDSENDWGILELQEALLPILGQIIPEEILSNR